MPSVLGKRTRNIAAGAEDGMVTRSKRRNVVHTPNDENQNPFVHVDEYANGRDGELPTHFKVAKKPASVATIVNEYGNGEDENGNKKSSAAILPSPQTPRHRDALSKQRKVPVTPRHRALASQQHIARTRGGEISSSTTPVTPSSRHATAATTGVYRQARQLFSRCSDPGIQLVGRDKERQELSTFVQTCLQKSAGGCLYVSGPPGTGKSALVDEVLRELREGGDEDVRLSVVNCMSVRSAKDLTRKLAHDLDLRGDGHDDVALAQLPSFFTRRGGSEASHSKQMYLVVMDEVDHLVDLDLELLYSLFEWSMQAASRLVLIGIANALDLTDRFLPRLKARSLRPGLLPFMPYTAPQIVDVLTAKLRTLSSADGNTQEDRPQPVPFLHPSAIQFCAKKVAAHTGDLRKAFDLCRRAIDLVEQEISRGMQDDMLNPLDDNSPSKMPLQKSPSKRPLQENPNLSSPLTPRLPPNKPMNPLQTPATTRAYTPETAPRATIAHMAQVSALAFSNGMLQRLTTLNLQQKAVLCALAALEERQNRLKRAAIPALLDRSNNMKNIFSTPSKKKSPLSHHNTSSLPTAPSMKSLFNAYTSLLTSPPPGSSRVSLGLLTPLSRLEFADVVSGLEGLGLLLAFDSNSRSSRGNGTSFSRGGLPMTPSRTPTGGRRGKAGAFGAGFAGPGFGKLAVGGTGAEEGMGVAGVLGFKELRAALLDERGEVGVGVGGAGGAERELLREILEGDAGLS